MEEDNKIAIYDKPVFKHKEIESLYKFDADIDKSIFEQILALPRESLISDLLTALKDADRVYKIIYPDSKNLERDQSIEWFPLHVLLILSELRAEESLTEVLEFLSKDDVFIDFWLSDYLTEYIWEVIYYLGRNKLSILKEFIKNYNVDTYSRSEVCVAVSQIAFIEPERRNEVIEWFRDLFLFFINNADSDDKIDIELISLMIGNIIDIKGIELLNEIENLFDNYLANTGVCGSFKSVLRDIKKPVKDFDIRKRFGFFERYQDMLKTWRDVSDNEYIINDDDYYAPQNVPLSSEPKIYRNDPCPCGSGKKFKKCHGAD